MMRRKPVPATAWQLADSPDHDPWNRERPRGAERYRWARVSAAQPPENPKDILATTSKKLGVSAPGLAPPVRRPGALPPPPGPRLAEYACSRDHDAYGERGHAGKQQESMKKPGHDSLPQQRDGGHFPVRPSNAQPCRRGARTISPWTCSSRVTDRGTRC